MCEFDPLHCDCHEWASDAKRVTRADIEEAMRLVREHRCGAGCPHMRVIGPGEAARLRAPHE